MIHLLRGSSSISVTNRSKPQVFRNCFPPLGANIAMNCVNKPCAVLTEDSSLSGFGSFDANNKIVPDEIVLDEIREEIHDLDCSSARHEYDSDEFYDDASDIIKGFRDSTGISQKVITKHAKIISKLTSKTQPTHNEQISLVSDIVDRRIKKNCKSQTNDWDLEIRNSIEFREDKKLIKSQQTKQDSKNPFPKTENSWFPGKHPRVNRSFRNDQLREIERENKRLLQRLLTLKMNSKSSIAPATIPRRTSVWSSKRRMEEEAIQRENLHLLMKIQNAKSICQVETKKKVLHNSSRANTC